jgi:hypothetical protein
MGDNKRSSNGAASSTPSAEEVAEALRQSQLLREEAGRVQQRAESTASEMSRVLRKLAAAIDRNPQSWDSLFIERRGG